MTQDLTMPGQEITADRADRMTAWWPRSPTSQIASRTDRNQIEASIKQLSDPCNPSWLMARVMALLTPYFTADVPEGVRRIEAEDWRAALQGKPAWAVEKACRWWKSDENPDHRKKPIEGDIADRVRVEMGILPFAAMKIREYDRGVAERTKAPEEAPPTPEEMARRREFAQGIMEGAGYVKSVAKNDSPRRETVTDADRAEMAELLAKRQTQGTE